MSLSIVFVIEHRLLQAAAEPQGALDSCRQTLRPLNPKVLVLDPAVVRRQVQ